MGDRLSGKLPGLRCADLQPVWTNGRALRKLYYTVGWQDKWQRCSCGNLLLRDRSEKRSQAVNGICRHNSLNMTNKKLLLGMLVFVGTAAAAQQRSHYTQYILNNYILNPALSGIENYTDIKLS